MDYREFPILNGKYKLATELTEYRMSLWICGFGIIDAQSNQEILPLIHHFNLDNREDCNDFLKIKFRIYPYGLKNYEVEIFPDKRKYFYKNRWYEIEKFRQNFQAEEDDLKKDRK